MCIASANESESCERAIGPRLGVQAVCMRSGVVLQNGEGYAVTIVSTFTHSEALDCRHASAVRFCADRLIKSALPAHSMWREPVITSNAWLHNACVNVSSISGCDTVLLAILPVAQAQANCYPTGIAQFWVMPTA